jgi:excisionase family DNA binding protein
MSEAGEFSISIPAELLEHVAQRAADLAVERLGGEGDEASPFLTIPEAAVYARCKRQRIDDLLSARRLTRYKDGRRTLVSRTELDAHLAAVSGPRSRAAGDSIFARHRATVTQPRDRP